jgi:hypothetical protein
VAIGTLLLVTSVALSACEKNILSVSSCVGIIPDAFAVTVRDQAGAPQALGAIAKFIRASNSIPYESQGDSVIILGGYANFTYDIQVTKAYYVDTIVHGLFTKPIDSCGDAGRVPVTVPVVLTLAPGAPPVRSVFALASGVELDRSPAAQMITFTPFVDANPGLSRAVTWRITGDTGSVTFNPANGAVGYRCLPKSGKVTVTASSVADSTVSGGASIEIQGHPAADSDPPCS